MGLRLGSVSRKCVQLARCPVVVVPGRGGAEAEPVVVVGVDGSEHSRVALRWAAQEAVWRDARLDVVHAWTPPALFVAEGVPVAFDTDAYEEASKRLLHDSDTELARGGRAMPKERRLVPVADAPARALLDAAKRAALLVVGARGRGGFGGLLLGSVSQQCVHHAPCPVAVVRAEAPGPAEP